MLKSKKRTPEEQKKELDALKLWLAEEREKPIEEMADFFASRLSGYEDVHLGHWAAEYAHIADYFDPAPQALLDIGCGTGLELDAIYRRFPEVRVTGIDLSRDMLEKLKEKYADKYIELIQADYFAYPFEAKRYDAALSFETLHHFPFAKKQKIYDKLYATLKKGGYYIECDYIADCAEREEICLEQYWYRRRKHNVSDDTFVHIDIPLTLEHQMELLKNAGFHDVRVLYENGDTVILRGEK